MGSRFSAEEPPDDEGASEKGESEGASGASEKGAAEGERSPRKRTRPDFDEDGAASLSKLEALADELARVDVTREKAAVTERLTQLLCKIDSVDTFGDPRLRAYRKKLIRRVEALEAS